jgi:hypothetical protein
MEQIWELWPVEHREAQSNGVCVVGRALALKRYQRAFAGVSMLPQGRGAIYDWEHRSQADGQIWNQREL